jgi:hypothetical protein
MNEDPSRSNPQSTTGEDKASRATARGQASASRDPASSSSITDLLPPEIQQLGQNAGTVISIFSSAKSAVDVTAAVLRVLGVIQSDPDVRTLFMQLNQHLDDAIGALSWQLDRITQADRLGVMQGYATTAAETVELTGMPLPVHDPAFQDSAGPLAEAEMDAFERTLNEAATDGPPITERGALLDHWKDYIEDRPPVSDGLVYDWRIGVPALMQLIALRLEIIAAVNPSFNTNGFGNEELRGARNALARHYTRMLQGVRDGGWTAAPDTERIFADIYTGFYLFDASPEDPVPRFETPNRAALTAPASFRQWRVLRQRVYDQMPLGQMRSLITRLDQLTSTLQPPPMPLPAPLPAPHGGYSLYQRPTVSMRPWIPTNSDFRPDQMALLLDLGLIQPASADTSEIVLFTQEETGFDSSTAWRSNEGGFTAAASKMVVGDFNGDSVTDVATLYAIDGDPHQVALFPLFFDGMHLVDNGSRLPVPNAEFDSSTLLAGDFDFDGTDDVAIFIPNTARDGEHIQSVLIYHSTGNGFEFRQQIDANVGSDVYRVLAGDFNGDGYADIAIVSDQGNGTSKITVIYLSADNDYTISDVWSGPRDLAKMKLVTGDFDGDGLTDIGALYGYGPDTSQFLIWCGSEDLSQEHLAWMSDPGGWTWESSKLFVGDFNADGYADLGIQYLSPTVTEWFVFPTIPDNVHGFGAWWLGDATVQRRGEPDIWHAAEPLGPQSR